MNAEELRAAIAGSAAYAIKANCFNREDRLGTFVAYLAGNFVSDEPDLYRAMWAMLRAPDAEAAITSPADA